MCSRGFNRRGFWVSTAGFFVDGRSGFLLIGRSNFLVDGRSGFLWMGDRIFWWMGDRVFCGCAIDFHHQLFKLTLTL
ncbi:hypothetical protein [Microcoleus sp. B4-D4]|uniref:hypothetical protein n=1 Tax=Microcoleus sp. B4-D4 TaxID=2818667 RepID=UPI002FD4F4C7